MFFNSTATESPTANSYSAPEPTPQPEIFVGENQPTHRAQKFYRHSEKARVCATLKSGARILVIGDSGMGKSVLLRECAKALREEGFDLAITEPMAPRQLLLSICEQLNIPTVTLEGKAMTIDQLKPAIADFLRANTAFLLFDDVQMFDPKFRGWLKKLAVDDEQPMAVFATEAPKSDLFLVLPKPLILKPLPEYAIRDLMEQTALKWGLKLHNRDFANLIPKASGVPAGAIALIEGEYIGVEDEGQAPTEKGRDLTPLLLIVALIFVVSKFIGLGTGNPMLYVMAGSIGSIFLTFYRLITRLPRDGRKIKA